MAKAKELSLPDASRALGLSWHQSYRLLCMGRLDARRVRGRYRITRESVERVKRTMTEQAPTTAPV